jgi:hypothetical protein
VEQQLTAAPRSPAEDSAGALHAAARRAIQGATTALAPTPAESTQGTSEPTGSGEREPGGQSDAQAVRGAPGAGASSGPHPAQLARMDTASAETTVGGTHGRPSVPPSARFQRTSGQARDVGRPGAAASWL